MRNLKRIIPVTILLAFFSFSSKKENYKKYLKHNFVIIPEGEVQFDGHKIKNDHEFYISVNEVTNKEYRNFLSSLSEADKIKFNPKQSNWTQLKGGEVMEKNYFNHPAYDNYPVVNISYEAALAYCNWLSKELSTNDEKYNYKVTLPSKTQWQYAAMGGLDNRYYANVEGVTITVKKGCCLMLNYRCADGENGDGAMLTAKAETYNSNDYGLYNINGNVAEMISEEHIAMGGSWMDELENCKNNSEKQYSNSTIDIGFRVVLEKDKI